MKGVVLLTYEDLQLKQRKYCLRNIQDSIWGVYLSRIDLEQDEPDVYVGSLLACHRFMDRRNKGLVEEQFESKWN